VAGVTTDARATPFAVVVMSDRELKSTPAHRTISSKGCFAVTPAEWQRFKQKLLEEAQKSPGVTVTPGQARAYIGGAGNFPKASGRQQQSYSPGKLAGDRPRRSDTIQL
jgi:hypothetical protein